MKNGTKHIGLQERLRSDILGGKYGEKLPNLRELGALYDVNFKTANKAITALVQEGLLYRQRGKGTYVSQRRIGRSDTLGLFFGMALHAIAGTVVLFENMTAVLSEFRNKPYTLSLRPLTEGLSCADRESLAVREAEPLDGGLVIGGGTQMDDVFRRIGFPHVSLFAYPAEGVTANSIDCDDRFGAFEMTEYLIGQGHRRIAALLGAPRYIGYQLRLRGYREALTSHGLSVDESLIKAGGSGWESGYAAMSELLRKKHRPTAVFCFSDFRAIGAIECAKEKGLRVPEDISVVGFDGLQAAQSATPALTTVAVPRAEVARMALEMLLSWISDSEYRPQRKLVRPRLVIRDSACALSEA